MKKVYQLFYSVLIFAVATGFFTSCSKKKTAPVDNITDSIPSLKPPTFSSNFDINTIEDEYGDVASFSDHDEWGSYNVHDPSIKKFGDYYYCYSTDVAYGTSVRPGIQIRMSKDLVQWKFVGWVFDGLPTEASEFIQQNGGTPNDGIWAPYIMKVGDQYRLYYALASNKGRLSVIGLATASNPLGPWVEKGLVVTSLDNSATQTNAIDPSVLVDTNGNYWLFYGSAWDGIYILKLDPSTGLAATPGDKGTRIANRGFTNGEYNGNIEAPEIIYNPKLKKYYLFISYDWLQTKYNVRVCRADNPQGPYYDYNGVNANENIDHGPMILAPYKFMNGEGWQGTGGCSVFTDGNGQFYMAHNARPEDDSYYMDLHVRKMFWAPDGWPVVSPERYAWDNNDTIPVDSIPGTWQKIVLNYTVVPGYGDQQTSPDFQVSTTLTIGADGTLNGNSSDTWTYNPPWLQFNWSNGEVDKVIVQHGHDWEKEGRPQTFIFTGLSNKGIAIWGKKN